jgi:ASCH domain
MYALSIKQPWATLVVSGRKSIEIRTWNTAIRGRIFIHAARIPDDRPQGWNAITEELRPLTALGGCVIGEADLIECRSYVDPAHFEADRPMHHNEPAWFRPPEMFGFVFRNPIVVSPFPAKGNVRFFRVEIPDSAVEMG